MQVFWCHNGDEFTLRFLEPSDISKFFFCPKISRYQSLPVHVFLKPQSHVIHVEQPGTCWATFSASFHHAQIFTIDDYIMTYLLFQILRNIIVALTKTDMTVILYIIAYLK